MAQAAATVERLTGMRPHRATLDRWRLRGCHGIKLESVRIGGKRFVSVEALRRFFESVTAAVDGKAADGGPSTTQRELSIRQAKADVDKAGI